MAIVRIGIHAQSKGFDKAARDVNRAVSSAEDALTAHAQSALRGLERQADGALIAVRGVSAKISQEGKLEDLDRSFQEATRTFQDFARHSKGGVDNLKVMRQTIRGITFEFDAATQASLQAGRAMTAAGKRAVDQARDQLELETKIVGARERAAEQLARARALINAPGGVLQSEAGMAAAAADPDVSRLRTHRGAAFSRARGLQAEFETAIAAINLGEHIADLQKENHQLGILAERLAKAKIAQDKLNMAERAGAETAATRAKIRARDKLSQSTSDLEDRQRALNAAIRKFEQDAEEGTLSTRALAQSMEFLNKETEKVSQKLVQNAVQQRRLREGRGAKPAETQKRVQKLEEERQELEAMLRTLKQVTDTGFPKASRGARAFGDDASKSLIQLRKELDKVDRALDKVGDGSELLRSDIRRLRREELDKADDSVRKLEDQLEGLAITMSKKDVAALDKMRLAMERAEREFEDLAVKADKAEDKLRIALEKGIEEPAREAEAELKALERQLDRVTRSGERTSREMRELALQTIRAGGDVADLDDPRFMREGGTGGTSRGRAREGVVDLTDFEAKEGLFSKFDRFGSKMLIKIGLIYSALGAAQAVFRGFALAIDAVVKEERFSDTMTTFINLSTEASTGLESLGRVFNALGGTVASFDVTAAAAKARMSGLAESTIPQVAQAARILSRAVGVDTTEAFDRLSRGIAKQEVEILDELGIIVRLNDALKKWADANGRTVASLTAQERQVAFANEVLGVLAARYTQIGTQLNRTTDSAAKLEARWKDITITAGGSLRVWSDIGIALGNAGAAIVDLVLPASGETRLRMQLLDSQVRTFGGALAEVLGKEGTVKDVVASLVAFQEKLSKLTEGSLEYEQTLEDQEEFLGKLKIAFPALNRAIAAYRSEVEGAAEALGKLLENQKEWLGLVSGKSLNDQAQGLAGMSLMADSVASSISRARDELDKLKNSDVIDHRALREAQADLDSLVEKEQALRKLSTSSALSLTGAGLTAAQAQPFAEMLQVFGQLRAGIGLVGMGGVGSEERMGVASRLANLSVSLDKAVEAGVFDPGIAANIKTRAVGVRTEGRGAAGKLLSQTFADVMGEAIRNTPEAGRDITRLLFESSLAAGMKISQDRAREFAHDAREILRSLGITDELSQRELGLGLLNAPVIRSPGEPARRSDVDTPAREIESRVNSLKAATEDAAKALSVTTTEKNNALLATLAEIEARELTGATVELRGLERTRKATEEADARLAVENELLAVKKASVEAAEAEVAAIQKLIGGGTPPDAKTTETFKEITQEVTKLRAELDTALLSAKLKASKADTALGEREFAALTKSLGEESTAAGKVLTERFADLQAGLLEISRRTGNPLGAILETLRLQRDALEVGRSEIQTLRASIKKQLTEAGASEGVDDAVDALLTTRLAELETLSDAIRATEARIPAQIRRTLQSSAAARGAGAAGIERVTDREGDFTRLFNLSGLGQVGSIAGLSAGRRRVEGMATSLEQILLPAAKALADMRAASTALGAEMTKLFEAGEGRSDSFAELSEESVLLDSRIDALSSAMESLQTRADSARSEGIELLAESATDLAEALESDLVRGLRAAGREMEALTGTPEKMERLRAIMGGRPADVTATLGGREFSFGSPGDITRRRSSLEAQIDTLTKRRNAARDDLRRAFIGGATIESTESAQRRVDAVTALIAARQSMLADLNAQETEIRAAIEAGDFAKLDSDIQKVVESGSVESITRQMGLLNDVLREMDDLTEGQRSGIGRMIEDLRGSRDAAQAAKNLSDELKQLKAVASARQGAIRAVGGVLGGRPGSILGGLATLAGGRADFATIDATRRARVRAIDKAFAADKSPNAAKTATDALASADAVSTMGKIAAGATLVGAGIEVATSAWSLFNRKSEEARQRLQDIRDAADQMGESISNAIAEGFASGEKDMDQFLRKSLFSKVAGEISDNIFNASEFAVALEDLETAQSDLNATQKEFVDARRDLRDRGVDVAAMTSATDSEAKAIKVRDKAATDLTKAWESLRMVQADDQADSEALAAAQDEVSRLSAIKEFAEQRRRVVVNTGRFDTAIRGSAETIGSLNNQIESAAQLTDSFAEQLGIATEAGKGISEIATATFRAVTEPQANLLLSATVEMRDLQVQIEWNTRRTAEVLTNDILGALLAQGFNAAQPHMEETAGGGNTPAAWSGMKTSQESVNANFGVT